jgi:PRTRC genetic system ThiF family protein
MKTIKPTIHFTANYLLQPTNPITVNLIGAGGNGSNMLTGLAKINYALRQFGHPGLFVRVFDGDIVTAANKGRQLFSDAEIGMNKGVALINRFNPFFGTAWKAIPANYSQSLAAKHDLKSSITISCVDTVKARFDIANILTTVAEKESRDKPLYWMDLGNSRNTGQVILSTIGNIPQPASKKFQTIEKLPLITEEFKSLLLAQEDSNEPSCSLAEALAKQDLFINPALANEGSSLLWQLFREGMIEYRGFFLNLKKFRSEPIRMPFKATKSDGKLAIKEKAARLKAA